MRSEEFDNASWNTSAASVTANTITSPDGTVDADTITEDATTASHGVSQSAAGLTASTVYTVSVYVKANTRNWFRITFQDPTGTDGGSAWFNLSTGVIGTVLTTGAGSNVSAAIQNVGNGWYRCSISAAMNNGRTTGVAFLRLATADGVLSYTGNGVSGLYVWGAQLEAGEAGGLPTSYIQTIAATASRAGDIMIMDGGVFSSTYNQNASSVIITYTVRDNSSIELFNVSDGTVNNVFEMRYSSGSAAQFQINTGGVNQVNLAPSGYSTINQPYTRAIAAESNYAIQYIDGVAPSLPDTSVSMPTTCNQLRVGCSRAGGNQISGWISYLAYYNQRLTNTELQELTR